MGISKYDVCDGVVDAKGALAIELGVVLRLRECLPSRPLLLPFLIAGGIFALQVKTKYGTKKVGRPSRNRDHEAQPRDLLRVRSIGIGVLRL